MKRWISLPLSSACIAVLALVSCGEKKEKDLPEKDLETVTILPEEKKDEVIKPPFELPVGFLNKLPRDTEFVSAIYQTDSLWEHVRNSSTLRLIVNSDSSEAIPVSTEEHILMNIIGKEIVLAQYGRVAEIWNRTGDFLLPYFTEKADASSDTNSMGRAFFRELIKKGELPPTLLALKNGDSGYELLKSFIDNYIRNLDPEKSYLTPAVFEIDGVTFNGYNMASNLAYEKLTGDRLQDDFQTWWDITLLIGKMDDYTVVFLGNDAEALKFAKSPEESVSSLSELQFISHRQEETPAMISYVSRDFVKVLQKFQIRYNENSFKELKSLLDTMLPLQLLDDENGTLTKARDQWFKKLSNWSSSSAVIPTSLKLYGWIDNGFHIDLWTSAAYCGKTYDLEKPLHFSHLADSEGSILFYEGAFSRDYHYNSTELLYGAGGLLMTGLDCLSHSGFKALLPEDSSLETATLQLNNTGSGIKKMLSQGLGSDLAFSLTGVRNENTYTFGLNMLIDVLNVNAAKSGLDQAIASGQEAGKTLFGQKWSEVPSLNEENLNLGSRDWYSYSIAPFDLMGFSEITSQILIGDTVMIAGTPHDVKATAEHYQNSPNEESMYGYYLRIDLSALKKAASESEFLYPYSKIISAVSKDFQLLKSTVNPIGNEALYKIELQQSANKQK